MTNFMDDWLLLRLKHLCLEVDSGTSTAGSGPVLLRSGSGAPLMSSKGISLCDPEREAGLLCVPLQWSSCRCSFFVREGRFSNRRVLDLSLKEPDLQGGSDSGESGSSPVKDRLLCTKKKNQCDLSQCFSF